MSDETRASREIALVRKEIKADINGLRDLLNARFTELGTRMSTMKESRDKQFNTLDDRIDMHETEIDDLTAWQNRVSGSAKAIAVIVTLICAVAGVCILL